MSRLAAFGIHLGISFLILLVLGALVVFIWYPGIFFETDGGWRGLRIIAAVDMVLGPALTLVVYKAGKPGLKKDLAMIGVFQFLCLFAGTYLVYSERPIAMVYSDGRFYVMSIDDYLQDANVQPPDLSAYPGRFPKWIKVQLPVDLNEQAQIRKRYIEQNRLLTSATEHYVPFEIDEADFITRSVDVGNIEEKTGGTQALNDWLQKHGGSPNDFAFFPIASRFTYGFLGFRRADSSFLGRLEMNLIDEELAIANSSK